MKSIIWNLFRWLLFGRFPCKYNCYYNSGEKHEYFSDLLKVNCYLCYAIQNGSEGISSNHSNFLKLSIIFLFQKLYIFWTNILFFFGTLGMSSITCYLSVEEWCENCIIVWNMAQIHMHASTHMQRGKGNKYRLGDGGGGCYWVGDNPVTKGEKERVN